MKRISTLSAFLLTLPLQLTIACETEKDDGLDTGAMSEEGEDEDEEDDDEDENEDTGASSAGTGEDDSDSGEDDDSAGTGQGSGGDSDSGEDDSDSGDDSAGTGIGGGEADGIAMLHGELPDIDEGGGDTGAGSGSDGDSAFPDDALLVVLDNDGSATCEDPWATSDCGGNWSISFTLLPEQMEPGTYALLDVNGGFSFADEPHPEGDCPFGGGTLEGTLVIESIDDEVVIGHIEDADAWDFDANVAFVVPRC